MVFNDKEIRMLNILVDVIIPRDEISGSATEAGVTGFIEYIAGEIPKLQKPLKSGLAWLDEFCLSNYGTHFHNCSKESVVEIAEQVAYPGHAPDDMREGEEFFSLLRNLCSTGFYTSKMGMDDIGYMGNKPNEWRGVPGDILKKFGLQDE